MHGWIVSTAVSQAGDMAWYVGLAWSAAQVTTPAGAGLVMGIGALPKALVLFYGGALADRFDGRRTMILANLGRIVVLSVAAAVVLAFLVKPRLPQPVSTGGSVRADLRAGFAYLGRDARARTRWPAPSSARPSPP